MRGSHSRSDTHAEPRLGTQCQLCRHREGFAPPRASAGDDLVPEPRPACRAFPAGIPDAITLDKFDHRKPHRGDRGIRWEPVLPGLAFPTLEPVDDSNDDE